MVKKVARFADPMFLWCSKWGLHGGGRGWKIEAKEFGWAGEQERKNKSLEARTRNTEETSKALESVHLKICLLYTTLGSRNNLTVSGGKSGIFIHELKLKVCCTGPPARGKTIPTPNHDANVWLKCDLGNLEARTKSWALCVFGLSFFMFLKYILNEILCHIQGNIILLKR